MSDGRFGIHGGQYIPETLMNEIINLEKQYNYYKNDPEFCQELDDLLKNYAGRPSLLYYAEKMTKGSRRSKNLPQTRGSEPHRRAQNQQRARTVPPRKKNGKNPCHRRDRSRPARCGNRNGSSADGT